MSDPTAEKRKIRVAYADVPIEFARGILKFSREHYDFELTENTLADFHHWRKCDPELCHQRLSDELYLQMMSEPWHPDGTKPECIKDATYAFLLTRLA